MQLISVVSAKSTSGRVMWYLSQRPIPRNWIQFHHQWYRCDAVQNDGSFHRGEVGMVRCVLLTLP
jgi:hypothetical protein